MEISIAKRGRSDWTEVFVRGHKISSNIAFNVALLMECFAHRPLCLITIQPQAYSIGHEFSDKMFKKVGKTKVLVSFLNSLTEESAYEICESSDYWLGLLLILEYDGRIIDDDYLSLIDVLDFRKGILADEFKEKLMFCSEDGKKINLLNCGVARESLELRVAELWGTIEKNGI